MLAGTGKLFYASAVGGNHRARIGLGRILRNSPQVCGEDFEKDWEATGRAYRLWLYHEGEVREIADLERLAKKAKTGFSQKEVEAENARGGKLSLPQVVSCKARDFQCRDGKPGLCFVFDPSTSTVPTKCHQRGHARELNKNQKAEPDNPHSRLIENLMETSTANQSRNPALR